MFETLFVQFLNAMLVNCLSQVSSETPQEYVKAHYNAATGKMDPDIVREAIPQARRAALKARRQTPHAERKDIPKLSYEQLYERCEAQLIAAMDATPEALASCHKFADTLGDDV